MSWANRGLLDALLCELLVDVSRSGDWSAVTSRLKSLIDECTGAEHLVRERIERHIVALEKLELEIDELSNRWNRLARLVQEHRTTVLLRWKKRKQARAARLVMQAEATLLPRLIKKAQLTKNVDPDAIAKRLASGSWRVSKSFWSSGIYGLFQDDKLIYIGLAENLSRRIGEHLKDDHKAFNRIGCVNIPPNQLKIVERLLLDALAPELNRDSRTIAIRNGNLQLAPRPTNPPTPAA